MQLALYSSKTNWGATSAITVNDKDGKGGVFDRIRIHNDKDHVEVTIRGKVTVEQQPDQIIVRLQDSFGDFIVRQR